MPDGGSRVFSGRYDNINVDFHRHRNPGRSNGRSSGSNIQHHRRSTRGGYHSREDRNQYYSEDISYNRQFNIESESEGNWRRNRSHLTKNNRGKYDPDARARNQDNHHGRPHSPHRVFQNEESSQYGRRNSHIHTGGGNNDSHLQTGQASSIDRNVCMSTLKNPVSVQDEPSTLTSSSNTVSNKQRTMKELNLKPRSDNKRQKSQYLNIRLAFSYRKIVVGEIVVTKVIGQTKI